MSGRFRFILVVFFAGLVAVTAVSSCKRMETPPVTPKETLATETISNTTEVAYVPKRHANDNDIEINRRPLKVAVNGKQHEIPTDTVKETQRLENGKVVVTEEQTINIEVPEQPRLKKGVYIEPIDKRLGVRLSYQSKNIDIDLKHDIYADKTDRKTTVTLTKWF